MDSNFITGITSMFNLLFDQLSIGLTKISSSTVGMIAISIVIFTIIIGLILAFINALKH
jgi:hypothetical protein